MNSRTPIKTQISGKYSPDNVGLFDFKGRVESAGAIVSYPVGNSIIEYSNGFAITVPSERTVPFHETEIDFLEEIGRSNLQITYNKYGAIDGYLGESTALETAFAMMWAKPVVLIRPILDTSPRISSVVLQIIEDNIDMVIVHPLDTLGVGELRHVLAAAADSIVSPTITAEQSRALNFEACRLTVKYAEAWSHYKSNDPAA